MADEQVIISVTYETEDAQKNVEALTGDIFDLENANKSLKDQFDKGKISQKEYSAEVEKNKIAIQKNKAERKDNIKFLKSEVDSIDNLRARNSALLKQRNTLSTTTKEGREKIAAINKEYDKNTAKINKNSTAYEKQKMNIGNYSSALSGLPGPLGGAVSGMQAMTKAAMVFIATPLGAVIAAIVAGLGLLKTFFNSSEEGQNALNKATKIFTVVLGNIQDLAAKAGEQLFKLFTEPKETLIKLGNLIKDNIVNRFMGMLELFPAIGRAIKLAFEGEFSAAAKTAGDALAKVTLGVEDFTDKVGEAGKAFAEETAKEINEAQRLADLQAELDKKDRALILDKQKLNAKISAARRKANDEEQFSAAERLEAITEVQKAEDQLAAREIEIANQRAKIKEIENSFSLSTKEDLDELENLRAKAFELQNSRDNTQLRLLRERKRLLGEIRAEREKDIEQLEAIGERSDDLLDEETERQKELLNQRKETNDAILDSEKERLLQEEEINNKRAQLITNAYLSISNATAQFIADQDASFKDFFKIIVNSLIDQLQAVIIAKNAEILAQSLATPDSIFSFGATGALRAAGIIAVTTAAGAAAKSGIQSLGDGGQLKMGTFGGNYHSNGGNNLYDSSGRLIANVEKDENFYVMKRDASAHINALSSINERFGGNSFGSNVAVAENGGRIPTEQPQQALSVQDIDQIISRKPIQVQVSSIIAGINQENDALSVGVVD